VLGPKAASGRTTVCPGCANSANAIHARSQESLGIPLELRCPANRQPKRETARAGEEVEASWRFRGGHRDTDCRTFSLGGQVQENRPAQTGWRSLVAATVSPFVSFGTPQPASSRADPTDQPEAQRDQRVDGAGEETVGEELQTAVIPEGASSMSPGFRASSAV